MKKAIDWLLMRKTENVDGKMESGGISITKICALAIAIMKAIEYVSPHMGSPIVFDHDIYVGIASIGGIALRDSIRKVIPPKPVQ